jgi:2-polyprenyl-6-methoxyphenol hydroxylase-like FAD-dependent oxidoreductase
MPRRRRKAAIIGGSLIGLMAARLLALRGWAVDVFERAPEVLSGRGAGIGTHSEFFDVLRAARLPDGPDIGVQVTMRRVLGKDGRATHEHRYPQVLAHWDSVYSLLVESVDRSRYHLRKKMIGFAHRRGAVSVLFEDGEEFDADLLIGADGIRSSVRSVMFPDVSPLYVSYIAWRGTVPEEYFSPLTRASMLSYFCFCLPVGEQMAGYPIRRVTDGHVGPERDYNFVWYRPTDDRQLDALLTDASGRRHEGNIPPPLVDPRHKQEAKEDAEQTLAPQFAEAVGLADGLFFQPIYDVETPRMIGERVALLGDAAFVARPHLGAGVTKGFSDAMALCEALERNGSIERALEEFETERLPVGRKMVERARQLGAYMQASRSTEEEKRAAEGYRTPEAVIRETAALDFLKDDGRALQFASHRRQGTAS